MNETILHEPYVVPPGQREVTGRFLAAPDFRLRGGNIADGGTAMGMITVPPGAGWVRIEAEVIGSPHLDPNSQDWTLRDVRGIHAVLTRDITIKNSRFSDLPRAGIMLAGVEGADISHTHSERCNSLLDASYFTGPAMVRNRGIHVHGFCTHRNGRSHLFPDLPHVYSVLDRSRWAGGMGIYLVAEDSEVVDFAVLGECNGCVKTVDGRNVRIARCIGNQFMLQGSCYWSPQDGPNAGTIPWPFGPKSRAKGIVIEDCLIHPRLTAHRFYEILEFGGNGIQLSYPQENTLIRNNHLWWEQGSYPTQHSAIQLAEGAEATLTGNVFHQATPESHHAIWNAPGNLPQANGFHGDSSPDRWPSKIINADWRTANQFSPQD